MQIHPVPKSSGNALGYTFMSAGYHSHMLSEHEIVPSQIILVADDDDLVANALASMLEAQGRLVVVCTDMGAAQMAVDLYRPTHVLSDIQFSGVFSFEGLQFLSYLRERAPQASVILMSGNRSPGLREEALRLGAREFLAKPFDLEELDRVLPLPREETEAKVILVPSVNDVVVPSRLRSVFQPIVDVQGDGQIIAVEGLMRYVGTPPFESPEVVFDYVMRGRRVVDLDLLCLAQHLRTAGSKLTASPVLLFMNIHPATICDPSAAEYVINAARHAGVDPRNVVLEITEQAPIPSPVAARATLETLRSAGFRFALDDMAIAYSHLPMIDDIRPEFMKVSQHYGGSFETSPTKEKIVRYLVGLSEDFNAKLILEGVETAETYAAARSLGIPLAQGYLFSRPRAIDELSLQIA